MTAALLCLAMTVYAEARGQPVIGQIAVAQTVMNRTRSPDYPDDVCSVVTQENQYPFPWLPPKNTAAWNLAVKIADDAMNGRSFDPTGGAMHYHRYDVRAKWSEGLVGIPVGDHVFFLDVN